MKNENGKNGNTRNDELVNVCIQHTYFGGRDKISFFAFCDSVIQDSDVALDIAGTMMEMDEPMGANHDQAEYYEEYEVINLPVLIAQMAEENRLIENGE